MPLDARGSQLVTFAVEIDPNMKAGQYVWITAQRGDTCQRVAARRGHPDQARTIADLNSIRSITTKVTPGKKLRLPGKLDQSRAFSARCDDVVPTPTAGYAKYDVIDRPGREGISKFAGYDPRALDITIWFDGWLDQPVKQQPAVAIRQANGTNLFPLLDRGAEWNVRASGDPGAVIDANVALLEAMAGRPRGKDPSTFPPIIRISTTNSAGQVVGVVPLADQWSPANPGAPLWRISNLAWDNTPGQVLLDQLGRVLRRKCVVSVTKYTPVSIVTRSTAARARSRAKAA